MVRLETTARGDQMNLDQIRDTFPEAQIERDNDGQIITYTRLFDND